MNPSKSRLSKSRVLLLGGTLMSIGTAAFYFMPGMIDEDATGHPLVNAFYCSTMTLTT